MLLSKTVPRSKGKTGREVSAEVVLDALLDIARWVVYPSSRTFDRVSNRTDLSTTTRT